HGLTRGTRTPFMGLKVEASLAAAAWERSVSPASLLLPLRRCALLPRRNGPTSRAATRLLVHTLLHAFDPLGGFPTVERWIHLRSPLRGGARMLHDVLNAEALRYRGQHLVPAHPRPLRHSATAAGWTAATLAATADRSA